MAKTKTKGSKAMAMPKAMNFDMPKPKIAPAPAKMAPRARTGIQANSNMAKVRAGYRAKTPKAG